MILLYPLPLPLPTLMTESKCPVGVFNLPSPQRSPTMLEYRLPENLAHIFEEILSTGMPNSHKPNRLKKTDVDNRQ